MSEVWGTVTAVDGEHANVHIDDSGCGRCHEPGGCGGQNLGTLLCPAPSTFRVLNPEHCGVGRRVRVRIGDGAVGRSALHAYALPVLALLAGAMAGSAVCARRMSPTTVAVSLTSTRLRLARFAHACIARRAAAWFAGLRAEAVAGSFCGDP